MSIKRLLLISFFCFLCAPHIKAELVHPLSGFQKTSILNHPLPQNETYKQLILGYQNLFSGFTQDFSHQDLAFYYPFKKYIFHTAYSQDHHPWLNESRFQFNSGYRTKFYQFSLGFQYYSTKFQYPENSADMNDPVLEKDNLTAFSLQIHQKITYKNAVFTLAVQNINQPDYS